MSNKTNLYTDKQSAEVAAYSIKDEYEAITVRRNKLSEKRFGSALLMAAELFSGKYSYSDINQDADFYYTNHHNELLWKSALDKISETKESKEFLQDLINRLDRPEEKTDKDTLEAILNKKTFTYDGTKYAPLIIEVATIMLAAAGSIKKLPPFESEHKIGHDNGEPLTDYTLGNEQSGMFESSGDAQNGVNRLYELFGQEPGAVPLMPQMNQLFRSKKVTNTTLTVPGIPVAIFVNCYSAHTWSPDDGAECFYPAYATASVGLLADSNN